MAESVVSEGFPRRSAQPLAFQVFGIPKPQGSKKGFVNKKTGAVIMTEQAGAALTTWREDVKQGALKAMAEVGMGEPHIGPVAVSVRFFMPRPKYHFRTGKNAHLLKEDSPRFHTTTPDVDKCIRSVLDALTVAGVWRDDAQVASLFSEKRFVGMGSDQSGADAVQAPGAWIEVNPLW
jgi:Holliday junction resolvase RusA-like endonuclease